MRFLTIFLALTLSTVATAADPECVDAVSAPVDALAQELPPEQAALLYATIDEGDITEATCDGPPPTLSQNDWISIQAPDIVCDALDMKLSDQLRLMGKLSRMAMECEMSPTCDAATLSEYRGYVTDVRNNVLNLLSFMTSIGC